MRSELLLFLLLVLLFLINDLLFSIILPPFHFCQEVFEPPLIALADHFLRPSQVRFELRIDVFRVFQCVLESHDHFQFLSLPFFLFQYLLIPLLDRNMTLMLSQLLRPLIDGGMSTEFHFVVVRLLFLELIQFLLPYLLFLV